MKANLKKDIEAVQYEHFIQGSDELSYGPIRVVKGKYAGRIGCFDDIEGAYGYVYWGDVVLTGDSRSKIKLSYLSNEITTYDIINRANELQRNISLARSGWGDYAGSERIIDLYGEYMYIMKMMNRNYEETFYLRISSNQKVFLSHSSSDKALALYIATDLQLVGISVWLDIWDINVGNSIPDKINQGLDDSMALIMLVSDEYLNSVYCADEWEAYYLKFNKTRPNAIIPIMIGSAQPPILIAARKYFRINENYDEYDEMLKKIKKAIAALKEKK